MENTITVAWALPVEAPSLCARLEAYAMSKSTISTLTISVQRSGLCASWPGFPQEVIDSIAVHIRQENYEKVKPKWKRYYRCCNGDCTPLDHLSAEELQNLKDKDEAFDRNCPYWQLKKPEPWRHDPMELQILREMVCRHKESLDEVVALIGQHESDTEAPEQGVGNTFKQCLKVSHSSLNT